MKNRTPLLIILLATLAFLSFSPSLDGRAVIANEGQLPKGIFAKTVGYLPGDSITVTNLAKQSTLDILVIGSLDPSEGIAILLTPEAGKILGIAKDTNNLVKITKREGDIDKSVNGNAIIGNTEPSFNEEENAPSEENTKEEEKEEVTPPASPVAKEEEVTPYIVTTIESNKEETDSIAKEEFIEPEAPVTESEAISEEISESPAPDSKVYEEVTPDPLATIADSAANSERVTPDTLNPLPEQKDKKNTVAEVVKEEVPAAPKNASIKEEKVIADDLNPAPNRTEIVTPDAFFSEKVAETYTPMSVDIEETCPTCPLEEEKVSSVIYEEEDEKNKEIEDIPEVAGTTPPKKEVSEEKIEDELKNEAESYEAIRLVEASPNPPDVVTPCPPITEEMPLASSEEKGETSDIYSQYTVPSIEDLQKGKYYVQIAVYKDKRNLNTTFSKYQDNYPITLVPIKENDAMQVMIGPLGVDEYSVVLTRFKEYGYKDAFLRSVK